MIEIYERIRGEVLSRVVKSKLDLSDISLISMNCLGGVLYIDCGEKFLTPTIDLFFEPSDFIKFVNNLDLYLNEVPRVVMGPHFPVGVLGNIKIYFMHYNSPDEAKQKWEDRKRRINKDRIFVIMVDRYGLSKKDFEDFKKIKYPKFLLTNKKDFQCGDSIYMTKYRKLDELPDIIPGRRMYYKMALPKAINKTFKSK